MTLGCTEHREAPRADCTACAVEARIEAALRAMPSVTPPAATRERVDAAIEQSDHEFEARLRSVAPVATPDDLRDRVLAALPAADPLAPVLGVVRELTPPADLAARVDAAIDADDAAFEARLRSQPVVEPPVDLRAGVLAALAWEDRLRRGAAWRVGAAGVSAAAAAAFLLADPAGWGAAFAEMWERADGWLPSDDAPLAPRVPSWSGPMIDTLDRAQAYVAETIVPPAASTPTETPETFSTGGLFGMLGIVAALVVANIAAARWWGRRA